MLCVRVNVDLLVKLVPPRNLTSNPPNLYMPRVYWVSRSRLRNQTGRGRNKEENREANSWAILIRKENKRTWQKNKEENKEGNQKDVAKIRKKRERLIHGH